MGGKSRKSGGVSKALINRIKSEKGGKSGGLKKADDGRKKPTLFETITKSSDSD